MAKLLFVLSGSIAAYKACEVISQLVQRGHQVRTVATAAALRFIGPATLEGLTRESVRTDLFAAGTALEHIDLDRWADALVICPASANTINRFASGLADDLAGTIFLAHDWSKPCLLAPAMNPAMWSHPATKEAMKRLRQWGAQFLPVGLGRTACGEEGPGRLAEPEMVVAGIEAALLKPEKLLRVLVTSGGTAEPIDGVRVLSNTSTGRTGAAIATYFARRGHDVTLLRARNALAEPAVREELFGSYAELDAALIRLLGENNFDVVVHAAAVSDFAVAAVIVGGVERGPAEGKIDSSGELLLRLRPQPKLVDHLKSRSRNAGLRVVAFKLTNGADPASVRLEVAKLVAHSSADFVVHNDSAADRGGDDFPSEIFLEGGAATVACATRSDLPPALEKLLTAAHSC